MANRKRREKRDGRYENWEKKRKGERNEGRFLALTDRQAGTSEWSERLNPHQDTYVGKKMFIYSYTYRYEDVNVYCGWKLTWGSHDSHTQAGTKHQTVSCFSSSPRLPSCLPETKRGRRSPLSRRPFPHKKDEEASLSRAYPVVYSLSLLLASRSLPTLSANGYLWMHQSTPPLPGFNAIRIDYYRYSALILISEKHRQLLLPGNRRYLRDDAAWSSCIFVISYFFVSATSKYVTSLPSPFSSLIMHPIL